jgi:hypothetical protein
MRVASRRYSVDIDKQLSGDPNNAELLFERACCLDDLGWTQPAVQAYLAVLQHDSRHLGTLTNLGLMVLHRGDPAAARAFFTQALTHHPLATLTHVNLGQALFEQGEIASAEAQYAAALSREPDFCSAHHGLATLYESMGDRLRADQHWERAFANLPAWSVPYIGTTTPVRVLVVISGRGGDVVTHRLLDDRIMETTMLYADAFRNGMPLAPHDVVFNGIGDPDSGEAPLGRARDIVDASSAPVINHPDCVRGTGRAGMRERFAGIAGVVVPRIERIRRDSITADELITRGWTFPLLVRAPGYHGGQQFEAVNDPADLPHALSRVSGNELFLIAFVDTRSKDGLFRKYRVLFVDGRLYPVHLAVSREWKVHYFSSETADGADHRKEEQRFLFDMEAALGAAVIGRLQDIERALGLDYGGADFGIDALGNVVLFEANATMAVYPPMPGEQWEYRRPAHDAVIGAARTLIMQRATAGRSI